MSLTAQAPLAGLQHKLCAAHCVGLTGVRPRLLTRPCALVSHGGSALLCMPSQGTLHIVVDVREQCISHGLWLLCDLQGNPNCFSA